MDAGKAKHASRKAKKAESDAVRNSLRRFILERRHGMAGHAQPPLPPPPKAGAPMAMPHPWGYPPVFQLPQGYQQYGSQYGPMYGHCKFLQKFDIQAGTMLTRTCQHAAYRIGYAFKATARSGGQWTHGAQIAAAGCTWQCRSCDDGRTSCLICA